MLNPYIIILVLFIVMGFFATLWGLRIIIIARRTKNWPSVSGIIEVSETKSELDEFLPKILYRYSVDGNSIRETMKFPGDVSPSPEFASTIVEKYPLGSTVSVYYDPGNPEDSTLQPGVNQGDWFVLVIGLGSLLVGILMLLFPG